ncbi:preprotein translocase subunit SecA [Roseimaritima ulvae]|uniref:Preprotein translocase subunit SecA n=1 Tax=Roseimaritima ulvae TaxID=980254 RepID=A0A5B9QK22_9BACT|nr:hypothetical protein [Roseimaritima ulvae]QEG38072.1 preprotein translocase subunit SecA [Roseimaritima ulvae]
MTALATSPCSGSPQQLAARSRHAEQSIPPGEIRGRFEALRLAVLRGAPADSDEVICDAVTLMSRAIEQVNGLQPYEVQRQAAVVMARGGVAEMATGEGKTLAVALAAAAIAVSGRGVHIATANDYLARRDCSAMGEAFAALGLRTSLVEPQLKSPQKAAAYAGDIVYGTADTYAFDFLHDVVARRQHQHSPLGGDLEPPRINRRRYAALIDEIDHILIDEASTPLVLSIAAGRHADEQRRRVYQQAAVTASHLMEGIDWQPAESGFRVRLTEEGQRRIAQQPLPATLPREILQRPWVEYVQRAIEAEHRVRRDVDYVVRDDQVQIVDPATGRIQPDRRWQDGLHQAVEQLSGLSPTVELESAAQITRWRFFDLYERLSGCSGTAWDARRELSRVYGLTTSRIPLRCPSARRVLPARCFATQEAKFAAIAEEVRQLHEQGRPLLLGTENIQQSQQLADALRPLGLPVQVLNGIQAADEAAIVTAAGKAGAITIATDLAGRGTDIQLSGDVARRGGLHVIVVSPRCSSRLDRQLIGRAARQGQPGSARTYISADDTLLTTHAPWAKRTTQLQAVARQAAARAEQRATNARIALASRDRSRESFVG